MISSSFQLGKLRLKNRLIQGPLAGFSASPMRARFYDYEAPAYCVTEMLSAQDIVHKHKGNHRYLHRDKVEAVLAYQLSGIDPQVMAKAALICQELGADLIDINVGCPKPKIRKKGAGSKLLESPVLLFKIVDEVKKSLSIPLTVKIRIQTPEADIHIAKNLESLGISGLIVHGRTWQNDYDIAANYEAIRTIKQNVSIPVIANGDIKDISSLNKALDETKCDAFMIARAGTGKPNLYHQLLRSEANPYAIVQAKEDFFKHIDSLLCLEPLDRVRGQAKALAKYYFRDFITQSLLGALYQEQDWDKFITSVHRLPQEFGL